MVRPQNQGAAASRSALTDSASEATEASAPETVKNAFRTRP